MFANYFRFLCGLLFFLLSSACFASTWQGKIIDQFSVKNKAAYRLLEFTNQQTEQTVYIHLIILKKNHYQAQLIDQKPYFSFFSFKRVYQTTKDNNAFLGINGGFFTPKNNPLGLVILNGKKTSSLSHSKLLSGLLLINKQGQVSISWRNKDYAKANYALQAGPFLIQPGGRFAFKTTGEARRRTAIAIAGNSLLVISTSPVSLYSLGYLLYHFPQLFDANKINVALNLDGGSSTAMTAFFPERKPLVIPELLPVRNAVIFNLQ